MTIPQALQLAFQHHQAGRLADAEALYRQILAVQPNHADALHHLGLIAHQMGQHAAAADLIRRAILLDPNSPSAHSNLGEVLRSMGQLEEAIAAYRCAVRLNPNYAEAHNNLGNALRERGQLDEAITALRRALELKSDYPDAHYNLGIAYRDQGQLDKAVAAYRRALQSQPEHISAHSNLIYILHFHPSHRAGTIAEERRRWNWQFGEPLRRFILPHTNDRSPERRLRIGYVSPDFRDHVVGRNLIPLFRQRDRRNFEIICYSGDVRPDELTHQFRQCADRWRNTVGMADEALAEMIRADGVDILVDLSQHLAGNRLPVFARKPAPVQISFAGYPESVGLDSIENRISDRYLESDSPTSEGDHKEHVHLIDSFWCYDPCGMDVAANPLPAFKSKTVTFGSLGNFCKINEPMLKVWARVLGRVADSRMLILSPVGSHRKRTLEVFQEAGVETARIQFVEFRPRREYLELYHRLDIVLDPFPYNGHTTSLDALWMGVPVVSLVGDTPVSRAGLSQLSNVGLPELVAHSESEYVNTAENLARDLPRLAQLRSTLRHRMKNSVLMDAPGFAGNVEAAYRSLWQRWVLEQSLICKQA